MKKEDILGLVPTLSEEDAEAISGLWEEALLKEKDGFDADKIREEALLTARQEFEAQKRETAVKEVLENANSKNIKALHALIDFEKVDYQDGVLTGLSEQIDEIKKECDYLFFGEEEKKPRFTKGIAPFENRVDLSGLSYKERLKLFKEMPEIYDRLAK